MEKAPLTYETFLLDVSPLQRPFVDQIHALFTKGGCGVEVAQAKSSYVVSYQYELKRHVVANFIFRKSGVVIRVYGDHVGEYQALLADFPEAVKAKIVKAGPCRRMLDPTKCNSRCPMGNVFTLDGVEHKKCRYNNFLIPVTEENTPHILRLLQAEMNARTA